jgi:hypothetical protein
MLRHLRLGALADISAQISDVRSVPKADVRPVDCNERQTLVDHPHGSGSPSCAEPRGLRVAPSHARVRRCRIFAAASHSPEAHYRPRTSGIIATGRRNVCLGSLADIREPIRDVRPLLESGRAECQQSMSQSAKCRLRAQLRITRYDRVSRSTDELD